MTLTLPQTLAVWGTEGFADTCKRELGSLDPERLPLQQLLRHGSHVIGRPEFMILGSQADEEILLLRIGVFFRSVLAGCSCADDPTPPDEYQEYGELALHIDRRDGSARVTVSDG
jgi:hypothetical protein